MTRAVLPHMWAQGAGRIVNVSSVLGFLPAPFASLYVASKHAIEGYSESTDHEVRQHGVRVLLVEPSHTNTGFEGRILKPDTTVPAYAEQRRVAEEIAITSTRAGDDPAIVAKAIVAAATDPKPRLRYTAGSAAGRLRTLRRVVPARAFDEQIRRFNRLPA